MPCINLWRSDPLRYVPVTPLQSSRCAPFCGFYQEIHVDCIDPFQNPLLRISHWDFDTAQLLHFWQFKKKGTLGFKPWDIPHTHTHHTHTHHIYIYRHIHTLICIYIYTYIYTYVCSKKTRIWSGSIYRNNPPQKLNHHHNPT